MVKFYDVDLLRALLKIGDEVVAEALLKHESIVTIATGQHILARATSQPVSVSPSIHDIVAAESIDRVLPLAACNEIVRAGGIDRIRSLRPRNRDDVGLYADVERGVGVVADP